MTNSGVLTAAYTIGTPTVVKPVPNPPAGAVASGTPIALTTTTAGASIYYTTNGSTPTTSSTLYSDGAKPTITAATTIKAIAVKADYNNSDILTAAYTVTASAWAWTKVTSNAAYATPNEEIWLEDVAYGNNKFIAVGQDGTPYLEHLYNGRILSSTDGTSWSALSGRFQDQLYGVAWGNDKFVAVGRTYLYPYPSAYYSSDGVSWQAGTGLPSEAGELHGAAWGNNIWVTVGGYLASCDHGRIYYSSNGTSWQSATNTGFDPYQTFSVEIMDVAYGNGKFIAVGSYGQMAFSTNGNSWTKITSSAFVINSDEHILSIATNGSGTWVAGARNGYLYISTDNGVTWTKKNSGSVTSTTAFSGYVQALTYDNGRFVALSHLGEIGYSTDAAAATWTKIYPNALSPSGINNCDVTGVAYGGGKFVAVGHDSADVPTIAYSSDQ
jgi:hypothetical protein